MKENELAIIIREIYMGDWRWYSKEALSLFYIAEFIAGGNGTLFFLNI